MKLVLVTRQGCHLCDEALALLHQLGHQPELVDVDSDLRLFELYDWRVPVLMRDGQVIAEGRISREQLVRTVGEEPA